MPTNEMTPQQRAVRVYKMLLEKPCKVAELARAVGLGRSGVYEMLTVLSSRDGIPITNEGGYWFLMPGYELRTVFAVYLRMRVAASITHNDADDDVIVVAMSIRESKIIMAILARNMPPMP